MRFPGCGNEKASASARATRSFWSRKWFGSETNRQRIRRGCAAETRSGSSALLSTRATILSSFQHVLGVDPLPRLSAAELAEARVRSGRLGGRPRKPTADEARDKALEELVPRAVKVLRDALDSGRGDASRPALRVLDHAWGSPVAQHQVRAETTNEVERLSLTELQELRTRLVALYPELRAVA
jgi:hypothetical protein